MTITKTFQSPDLPLREILDDIRAGKVQLPDFQRDWVWDDDHVVSLLASVSLSYPIGAVMLLETGADTTVFKPRLVESVELSDPPRPELLILDGQQRLTSLYGALRSGKPVKTKDRKKQVVERWYYIDMEKALDPNGVETKPSSASAPIAFAARSNTGSSSTSRRRRGSTGSCCSRSRRCSTRPSGGSASTSTGDTTATRQGSSISSRRR